MPGTRTVRDCGRRARNEASGRLSCFQRSSSNARPRFHEVISAISPSPNASGTHPPSGIFNAFAAKKMLSITKKPPNTRIAAGRDQLYCLRNTTIASTQVHRNVPVTAMP